MAIEFPRALPLSCGFERAPLKLFRFQSSILTGGGPTDAIDLGAVNRMIDGMVKRLGAGGQFETVVCDSVMA